MSAKVCQNCYVDWDTSVDFKSLNLKQGKPPVKERIEEATWDLMSKDLRKKYHKNIITAAEARKMVKQKAPEMNKPGMSRTNDGSSEGETGTEPMDTCQPESMVPRFLKSDFNSHFKKLSRPPQRKLEDSTEEALQARLTPAARITTNSSLLQSKVEKVENQIKHCEDAEMRESLENLLSIRKAELQAASNGKEPQAAAVEERKALSVVIGAIDAAQAARKLKKDQALERGKLAAEAFAAQVAECRATLAQLETQYSERQAQFQTEWDEDTASLELQENRVKELATTRMTAAAKRIDTKTSNVTATPVKPEAVPQSEGPVNNGAENTAMECPVWQLQKEYRGDFDPSNLLEADDLELNEAQKWLPAAQRLWHLLQSACLDGHRSAHTFGSWGLTHDDVELICGVQVVKDVFRGQRLAANHVISDQLMEILMCQLLKVHNHIHEKKQGLAEAQEAAKKVFAKENVKTLNKVKKATKKNPY
jgi:hypothetical protein